MPSTGAASDGQEVVGLRVGDMSRRRVKTYSTVRANMFVALRFLHSTG